MRALLQRVAEARVTVAGEVVGQIGAGLLVYVGVAPDDTPAAARWLARKVANLRIFADEQDKLNRNVRDARGSVLVVSNFTLLADARRGRRPSFVSAAGGDAAEPLTRAFVDALRGEGLEVATGVFGAMMSIDSQAAGPVNVLVDTPADAAHE